MTRFPALSTATEMLKRHLMRGAFAFALSLVLGASPIGVGAQTPDAKLRLRSVKPADFPSKPIELSVGAPAGGGMDVTARLLAKKFTAYTGEAMVVTNRDGAGGLLFHRWLVTQAPNDGHSIGMTTNSIVGDTLLRAEGKWSYRDVDNLAFVNYEPVLWLASRTGRFKDKSLAEVLAVAKNAGSGEVKVGTVAGTFIEMLAEQVEEKASLKFTKVPYNGVKPSVIALMGDHIDISFGFIGDLVGHADKVRPLAVAGTQPVADLPGVPTFNSVLKTDEIRWVLWRYVAAPRGVAADRNAWLRLALRETLADPQLTAELKGLGAISDPSLDTPEKVMAVLDGMAAAERQFYLKSGRLKQ